MLVQLVIGRACPPTVFAGLHSPCVMRRELRPFCYRDVHGHGRATRLHRTVWQFRFGQRLPRDQISVEWSR